MNSVYLSLGSNRGNREQNLQQATGLLAEKAGKIAASSSVYETEPWRMDDNASFLNQVLLLETKLKAAALMDMLLAIETGMGRTRTKEKYEPRIIDIDILLFNTELMLTDKVVIPHPYLHQRKFVLAPLAEIAPGIIHPALKKTIEQLLLECDDRCNVSRLVSK